MKKVLKSLLFVGLVLCLFVGCDDGPVNSVTFKNAAINETIVINRDGSGTYTYSGETSNFNIGPKNPSSAINYRSDENGMICHFQLYERSFFKSESTSNYIVNFDDLVEADKIYNYYLSSWRTFDKVSK